RFEQHNWTTVAVEDRPLPLLPDLSHGLHAMVLTAVLRDKWRDVARRAQAGRFLLLGQEWPGLRGLQQWHLDPVNGRLWPPQRYCFAIGHRHAKGYGDVKFVWELNRLQYLQPIAALSSLDSDAGLARFCADEVESWIDANPPFRGVSWKSGIELALRVVSLLI